MRKPAILFLPVLALLYLSLAAAEERRGPYNHPPRSVRSRDVDQQHLRLELSIDLDKEAFRGRAIHTMSPLKPVRVIKLDAADMKIDKVTLGDGANAATPRELKFETRANELEIALDREYAASETLTLTIDYRVDHPTSGGHFVVPDESEPNRSRTFWTQGEPEEARFWVPCIDSPSSRLTSEVLVTVPKQCFVLSNGVLRDTKENADGTHTFHWVQEQSLATYLLSVVAGEFESYEQQWDGIPITAYVPKGRLPDAERSFKKTASMVEYFSRQIGVRYPWPKYAQICVDDFGGGMENASATTLEVTTLHDERAHLDVSSDNLVAHELAHQWWGDLLTSKDWAEIWLNESFATYFATLWTEHDLGADEATWARRNEAEVYLTIDKGLYRRPIVSYTYEQPWGMFDSNSYQKGGRVLHMLRFVLGDELFWKSLRRYAEKHRLGTVEAADLRIAIEEATGQGLNWFFDEWLSHGGHPEFAVSWRWDEAAKTVLLTVKQTQKVDDVTPLFETPVEIELATRDVTVIRRVNVSHAEETFHFITDSRPTRVCFDPRDWILKRLSFDKS
jgi:aminopeptidase N